MSTTIPQGQINAPDQLDFMNTVDSLVVKALHTDIEDLVQCTEMQRKQIKALEAECDRLSEHAGELRRVHTDRYEALEAQRDELVERVKFLEDFESDAKRLALELECLIMSTDLPACTKWWDSAHEALELHRKTINKHYGVRDE
jgi:predicted nuclease with TOPRIM domain